MIKKGQSNREINFEKEGKESLMGEDMQEKLNCLVKISSSKEIMRIKDEGEEEKGSEVDNLKVMSDINLVQVNE